MEDYVTYKQALALKNLGFDWKCDHYYGHDDKNLRWHYPADNMNEANDFCSAPHLWYAQKWLRKVKKIIIFSKCEFIDSDTLIWTYTIYQYIPEGKGRCKNERDFWNIEYSLKGYDSYYGDYPTYEAALSAGIDEALKIIK